MRRVQVNYDPSPENLKTTESPTVRTQRAVGADQRLSGLDQLIGSLATHYPSFRQLQEQWQKIEKDQTQVWAESMSTQELADKVRSGKMPFNSSPIAVATAQHVYGSNKRSELERDVLSKISTGELRFNSQEELDAYLSEQRTGSLAGESKYTAYGFDKGLGQTRQRVLTTNVQFQNREFLENSTALVTQRFQDLMEENPDLEAALEPLRSMEFAGLPAYQRAQALGNIGTWLASRGDGELLEKFMRSRMGDGLEVSNILGPRATDTLKNRAKLTEQEGMSDYTYKTLNELEQGLSDGTKTLDDIAGIKADFIERYGDKPEAVYRFNNAVDGLARESQKLLLKKQAYSAIQTSLLDGGFTAISDKLPVSQKEAHQLAQAYIDEQAVKRGWTPDQRLDMYVRNGVEYPNANALKTLPSRMDGLLMHPGKDGRPEPDEGTVLLYQEFELLNRNPGYAREQLGNDVYEKLNALQACRILLGQSEVETLRFGAENMLGGNVWKDAPLSAFNKKAATIMNRLGAASDTNTEQVIEKMRPLVSLLSARMSTDQAIDLAVSHFSNPGVTFVANGAVYFLSDFPAAPKGRNWQDIIPMFIEDFCKEHDKVFRKSFTLYRTGSGLYQIVDSFKAWPEGDSDGNVITITPQQLKEYADSWGERKPGNAEAHDAITDGTIQANTGNIREALDRASKETSYLDITRSIGEAIDNAHLVQDEDVKTFFAKNWTFDTPAGQKAKDFLVSDRGRTWRYLLGLANADMETVLRAYNREFGTLGHELKRYDRKRNR